jgi:light-regulated signal transduction histidine kinase (bacteriophytochrome)
LASLKKATTAFFNRLLGVGMHDRRRLLFFSVLILLAVALAAVAATDHALRLVAAESLDRARFIAVLETLALVIAGGTLLVRASNPFMWRLEQTVSALQETKRRLEAHTAELTKINRELDDFTYIASHDLKEPLRGISSYCQILLEDYQDRLDDDGRRRLQSLVSLCARLGQLIDDLLTYSRIGRTPLAAEPIRLDKIASDAVETLQAEIERRGAVVELAGDMPTAMADPTMIGEVLRNLISNGLKFNESPRPHVEIGCLPDEPCTIYVRDNGIGIPAEHHEEIFAMFRRLHSRRKYDGTGAGLTIVRKIVESFGGRIWLESVPELGTTFFISLRPGVECEQQELATCAVG